ncbi:MAG TPA: CaiB/BaiF CoA-transferase family protein [Candidatus Dormibacteraeota bacterium]|nr:CaiB/BaiF CoA-transferase family protein [Candidatus Dormibacteraeota bacterium]
MTQADDSPGQLGTRGALDGITVLDCTQMLAGPLAGLRLGDLGADVLKIEAPGSGEFNRTHGFEDITAAGEMTTFLALNRNKRSVVINLKKPDGLAVMHDLVRQADVLIQNFRVGTADRIGIGYEQLHEINPRLIYCAITGYGSQGPYRNRAGQDLVLQGYSGSMWSVGKVGDPPLPSALWAADVMSGYQAVVGVLAALNARNATGGGQYVEVDMLSSVLDAQLQELVTYLNSGRQPTRMQEPSAHALIPAPYGVYQTRDGWLTMAMCYLPDLGEALDDDWLKTLVRYNDGAIHRNEIYARIRPRFSERTTAEWLEILERCGVWAGPVYDYAQLERDPHVVATGTFTDQAQGGGVMVRTLRPPLTMSATPLAIRRGAPPLGAHTAEVLTEKLGYDRSRVARLIASGAVGAARSSGSPEEVA